MFAILSCRHPDTIFQYPDSLNAYPNALQSIQILSVQQPLLVSECSLGHSNWLLGIQMLPPCIRIPSASATRSFSSASECLLMAFEYHFKHPNSLVRHPDTLQQNFKINFRKFKNYLFSIKIVYYLSLLKIIVV